MEKSLPSDVLEVMEKWRLEREHAFDLVPRDYRKSKMQSYQPLDPHRMYNTARCYSLLFQRADERRERPDGMFEHLIFQAQPVAALSAEISLKGLLVLSETDIPKIHDLHELFKRLRPEIKEKVVLFTEEHRPSAESLDAEQFLLELYRCRNVFEKWRYLYEGRGSLNVGFLGAFMYGCLKSLHFYGDRTAKGIQAMRSRSD